MMTPPLLYTAELDLPEAEIEPFSHWYAYRHTPDLYRAGFLTCTCYRVEGGDMNLLDLYEAPGWEIFESPRYLAMRGRDPYMAPLMERRRNKAHTVYEQRLIVPSAEEACLDADWLSVFRFEAPADADDAIADALSGGVGGTVPARIRFARRTKDHPRNPTFRPRCMLVLEWPERPPGVDLLDLLRRRCGAVMTNEDTFVGRRLYPWPDRPA